MKATTTIPCLTHIPITRRAPPGSSNGIRAYSNSNERASAVTPTSSNLFELIHMKRGGKPFQSKLIPYYEEIRQLRRQRKSYAQISLILVERHGESVRAAHNTIQNFVKVRRKRPGPYELREPSVQRDLLRPDDDPLARLRARQPPNLQPRGDDPWDKLKPSNKPLIIEPK